MSWEETIQEARDNCPAGHTDYQPVSMDLRCPTCGNRLRFGLTFTKSPTIAEDSICDMFHDDDHLTCDCGGDWTGEQFAAVVDPG